ncbi:MAG: hypothetical protein ACFFD2_12885 [Promethearchaeota archaeon]
MEKLNTAIFRQMHRYFRCLFWKKAIPVTINFIDHPFYTHDKATPRIIGAKKKVGTNWHYRFAAITILKTHL